MGNHLHHRESRVASRPPRAPQTALSFRSAKNKIRKNLRRFAYYSPLNSFRINESISKLSTKRVKLRQICAPQPIWNQRQRGMKKTVVSLRLTSLKSNDLF